MRFFLSILLLLKLGSIHGQTGLNTPKTDDSTWHNIKFLAGIWVHDSTKMKIEFRMRRNELDLIVPNVYTYHFLKANTFPLKGVSMTWPPHYCEVRKLDDTHIGITYTMFGGEPVAVTYSKNFGIVYQSEHLIIQQLSAHIYQHISFLNTNDFGKVSCNGMIIINENEAIIFDTPAGDTSSVELIDYLTKQHHYTIKAIIPTHFHEDCVAGLEKFNEKNIPSWTSNKTIALLKSKGRTFSKPLQGFDDSLILTAGNKKVYIAFFGEGHTKDNIVGYFPEDAAVFGGCLIKETGAGKGNLADANVAAWPGTVSKLKQTYPQAQIVIPGHGKTGGTELFDYTIQLFK